MGQKDAYVMPAAFEAGAIGAGTQAFRDALIDVLQHERVVDRMIEVLKETLSLSHNKKAHGFK